MPRPSHLSPDNILRFLQVRRDPASAEDIARGLHVSKTDRRPLFKMLAKLKKRGVIVELPGGRYRLAGSKSARQAQGQDGERAAKQGVGQEGGARRDEISGRLVLHHDGYGFVVPDTPMPQFAGDIFIPRDSVEDAMHGDRVVAKILRIGSGPGPQRAEGRIVRVVGRAHPTVVGQFRVGSRGNSVLPYDARMQHAIEIPPGQELTAELASKFGLGPGASSGTAGRVERAGLGRSSTAPVQGDERGGRGKRTAHLEVLDGAVVNVEVIRFPRGGAAPTGRVIEILGRPGELGVDIEIMIRKHHLPHVFPANARRKPNGALCR